MPVRPWCDLRVLRLARPRYRSGIVEVAGEGLLSECRVAVFGFVEVNEEADDHKDGDGRDDDVEWAAKS